MAVLGQEQPDESGGAPGRAARAHGDGAAGGTAAGSRAASRASLCMAVYRPTKLSFRLLQTMGKVLA